MSTVPNDPSPDTLPLGESPASEHYEAGASKDDSTGEANCSAECGCGLSFGGFPTLAEARQVLAGHIARAAAEPTPMELAASYMADASGQLRLWKAKKTDLVAGTTYVAAGHQAIREIDEAVQALHEVRQRLIREIRADEEERAIRVDLMLAEYRARREAQAAEVIA